jgi:ABC-type polysaccharide/polyol phosphate export permease
MFGTATQRRDGAQGGARGGWRGALVMADLIYHSTVRNVRKGHRNAAAGLLMSILQTVIFLAAFWVMFTVLGVRGNAVRGDFLLYLMSGIFLFMIHTKAVGSIVKAEGPTSPMMQHAPLNTFVTMASSALAALYLQLLSMLAILFVYHVAWTPVVIDQPLGALAMVLLAWFSGVGVGVCLAALRPWFPDGVLIASSVYSRANMIASGKMFVANTLPGSMLAFFDWNPLFHAIDQARGYIFLNYNPHFTSWEYALWVSVALLVLGLMGESYTRRRASLSWSAGR